MRNFGSALIALFLRPTSSFIWKSLESDRLPSCLSQNIMDFSRIDILREDETAESRAQFLLDELLANRISVADLMGPVSGITKLSADIVIPPGDKSVFPSAPNAEFFPKDQHNELLEEHVHPPNYVNPSKDEEYDLVVIGAGVAGLISSIQGAWLGKKVAMIERHAMGGDCLNIGCVPSKAFIVCAKQFAHLKELRKFGISLDLSTVSVDFAFVMERMRKIRAQISHHDSVQRYSKEFCEHVYVGQASFLRNGEVQVVADDGSTRLLRYKKAMIGSGASAAVPPELVNVPHLTNANFFNLVARPPRVAVLGCGPIGLELAQSLTRFGSTVTCLERGSKLLFREDQEAVAVLQEQLDKDGLNLVFGARVTGITVGGTFDPVTGAGLYTAPWLQYRIEVELDNGEKIVVEADAILNATGRAPNVHGMGLENVNVDFDNRRGVLVDEFFQTSNKDIFACGDCCSAYKFTHAADFQARTAVRNMYLGPTSRASDLLIPWCTYTEPEIAHVGRYEEELTRKGIPFELLTRQLKDVDRCMCDGVESGFVKIIVAAGSKQILGATICGSNAGDMISQLTLAMQHGITVPQIAGTIHPYPTTQEAVRQTCLGFNKYFKNPTGPALMALKLLMARREQEESEQKK